MGVDQPIKKLDFKAFEVNMLADLSIYFTDSLFINATAMDMLDHVIQFNGVSADSLDLMGDISASNITCQGTQSTVVHGQVLPPQVAAFYARDSNTTFLETTYLDVWGY